MGKKLSTQQGTVPTAATLEDNSYSSTRVGTALPPRTSAAGQANTAAAAVNTGTCLELLKLLAVAAFIIVPITAAAGAFDGSAGAPPPTPYPTQFPTTPADVTLCPVIFNGTGEVFAYTFCDLSGCDGAIRWCGLEDTSLYRVVVGVRGDLGSSDETVSITVGPFEEVVTGSSDCRSEFEILFNETMSSTAGELRLAYDASSSVNAFCGIGVAVELNVSLSEV